MRVWAHGGSTQPCACRAALRAWGAPHAAWHRLVIWAMRSGLISQAEFPHGPHGWLSVVKAGRLSGWTDSPEMGR